MEYRLTTHLGSGEISHVIENGQLIVRYEKSGRTEVIPFSAITEINLRQELAGVLSTHVRRQGGSTIVIPARHFEGVGRFEDRSAQYGAFLRALHVQAFAANPRIHFVSGSSLLFWLGVVIVTVLAAFGVIITVGVLTTDRGIPPLRLLWVIPLAFVVGGSFLRQGRAKPYDPLSPPAKLLPG